METSVDNIKAAIVTSLRTMYGECADAIHKFDVLRVAKQQQQLSNNNNNTSERNINNSLDLVCATYTS